MHYLPCEAKGSLGTHFPDGKNENPSQNSRSHSQLSGRAGAQSTVLGLQVLRSVGHYIRVVRKRLWRWVKSNKAAAPP